MAEVETLGLKVDGVQGVDAAAKAMDGLTDSAAGAEKAVDGLGKESAATNSILAEIARSVSPLDKSLAGLQRSTDAQTAALGGMETSLAGVIRQTLGAEQAIRREADAARSAEQDNRAFSSSLQSITDRADPLAAAQRKFTDQTEILNRAMREGKISAELFAKSNDVLERELKEAGEAASGTGKMTNQLAASLGRLAGVAVAGLGVRALTGYADAWSDMTSLVRVNISAQEDAADVMSRLSEIARGTYSSLEATARGFSVNAFTLNALGKSTQQQLDYTEALNNALVVSGARGQSFEMVQNSLNRAMAEGTLRGTELQNVLNYGSRVAGLLAEELGVNVTELRALAAQGVITGDVIYSALTKNMEELAEQAETMPATMADAFTIMRNTVLESVGAFDQQFQISQSVASAIIVVADNIGILVKALVGAGAAWATYAYLPGVAAGLWNAYTFAMGGATSATVVMTSATKLLSAAMALNPLGLVAIAVGALTTGYLLLRDATSEYEDTVKSLVGEQDKLLAQMGTMNESQLAQAAVQYQNAAHETRGLIRQYHELTDAGHRTSLNIGKLNAQLAAQESTYETLIRQLRRVQDGTWKVGEGTVDLEANMRALNNVYAMASIQSQNTADNYVRLMGVVVETSAAVDDQQMAVSELIFQLAEEQAMLTMTARQQAIYNVTKQAGTAYTWEQVEAIVAQINSLYDAQDALAGVSGQSAEAAASMTQDAGEVAQSWQAALERIDSAFVDLWKSAFRGFKDFGESLKNAFTQLLAELAHKAVTQKILISVGLGGTSGLASAESSNGDAGAALTLGGMAAGAGNLLTTSMVKLSQLVGSTTKIGQGILDTVGTFAKAGNAVGAGAGTNVLVGAGMSLGAGVIGGMAGTALGEAIFGKQAESSWGAAIGGAAGTYLAGPIGAAIGAALGGALDAAFGGDGKKRVTLGVETDPLARAGARGYTDTQIVGASGITYTGRATRADGAAGDEMAVMFAGIDNVLTAFTEAVTGAQVRLTRGLQGGSSQAGLAVQDSGANTFFGSAEFNQLSEKQLMDATGKFILAWLNAAEAAIGSEFKIAGLARQYAGDAQALGLFVDSMIALIDQLAVDPIDAAIAQHADAQRTALDVYRLVEGEVLNMAAAYDGSIESTQALTAALSIQQQMAGELAAAYLQVGDATRSLFGNLHEQIRTSLFTSEELYDYQRGQVDSLTELLAKTLDPETILATSQRIESITESMWNSLDRAQQEAMQPEFLKYLEGVDDLVQSQIAAGMSALDGSQGVVRDAVTAGIDAAAERMASSALVGQEASRMQLAAAERNAEAAQRNWQAAQVSAQAAATIAQAAEVFSAGAQRSEVNG